MPSLPVDTSDIYNQFGVSPKDYFIDPETNTIKRKELPLPVETLEPIVSDFQVSSGSKIGNRLFGTGGEERFQTWPERMVRSGSTIAGDVFNGVVSIESPTGYPGSILPVEQRMEPNVIGKALGIGNFTIPAATSEIGRTQDLAGMAGMSTIPLAPKGVLGAIGGKFYSTLENTIAGSKVSKATPEQWTSYLKNQPGVKPEELEFSLQGLGDKVLTKEELAQHVADNGIKFGEIEKNSGITRQEADRLAELDRDNLKRRLTDEELGEYQDLMDKKLEEPNNTKYSSYQLPGGENYRELLMTVPEKKPISFDEWMRNKNPNKDISEELAAIKSLPEPQQQLIRREYEADIVKNKDQYKSSHWDEPNVLAHIRMNDRFIPDSNGPSVKNNASFTEDGLRKPASSNTNERGLKTLHVEEIQSDWHQAGRKHGYKGLSLEEIQRKEALDKKPMNEWSEKDTNWYNSAINDRQQYGVPNAPFKKTWDELALKRVLSEAVEKGYDAVSWTPGEAQAARYDLSKHYDNITATKRQDGTYNIYGLQKGRNYEGSNAISDRVPENKLADFVGKDLAEKIVKDGGGEYSGVDLKVGGEGMKAFYDKMLVDKANALIKKMGGKVEYENINGSIDKNKIALEEYGIKFDNLKPNEQEVINKRLNQYGSGNQKIPIIKITPQMRENIANKGFPLYSSGVPTFSPVDNDPWNSKIKLVPVKENPFL